MAELSGTISVKDSAGTDQTVPLSSSLISNPSKASFTRPADTTAYTTGDLMANSTTAGSVTPLSWTGATIGGSGGDGIIAGIMLRKSSSTAVCTVRVHFFTASPTVANGDNGAFSLSSYDLDNKIGVAELTLNITTGNGYEGQANGLDLQYSLASGDTIYALIEMLGAYTPVSGETINARVQFKRFS